LIVGANNQDLDAGGGVSYINAGAAYIFKDNGTGIWEEDGKVVPQDPEDNGLVDFSVDISGIFANAGGYRVNTNEIGNEILTDAGAAYVYKREGFNNCIQVRKIVTAEREAMAYAAYSVAIFEAGAFFGSIREDQDENGNMFLLNSGSVFYFKVNENYYLY